MKIEALMIAGLLAVCPVVGQAQTAPQARTFVLGLYGGYGRGDPDYLGKGAAAVFSPGLLALLRRDQDAAPEGEAGRIDWDPICDCQDWDELRSLAVQVEPVRQGRTSATARFVIAGEPRTVTLSLVAANGGWRIDDIETPETPSLAALLREPL